LNKSQKCLSTSESHSHYLGVKKKRKKGKQENRKKRKKGKKEKRKKGK